ncbi:4-phosphopantetheinyl transferase, partial [Clostridioides difficile]|nr:4-phosphopantetheinyl transferase [Clostridioides difficile]
MTSLVIHAEVTCHLLHELVYLLIGPHKRENQKLIYISRVSLDTFPKSALPQLMERASPERRDRARRYVRIDGCLRCLIADELRAYSLKLDYTVPVQSEVSENAFGRALQAIRYDPKFNLSHDGK